MKVYIHEYAHDTTLLFSINGRVLGVYVDQQDALIDYESFASTARIPTEKDTIPDMEERPLDFDDVA